MISKAKLIASLTAILFSTTAISSIQKIGINVTNIFKTSEDSQNRMLAAISAANIKSIRTSIPNNEAGLDFARRVQHHNLKIHLIVRLDESTPQTAKRRIYDPTYPRIWPSPSLSALDQSYFRTTFSNKLKNLSEIGVEISAFEIFNEINTAAFNADFPIPGEGRQLSYDDFKSTPTGISVAAGLKKYISILKIAKEEINRSQAYKNTPLLSAGLGGIEAPEGKIKNITTDLVSINSTIKFLHDNGASNYVDGYGVHVYPWETGPGNPIEAKKRQERFERFVIANCGPSTKPCWITEWGFKVDSISCPTNDENRLLLVNETRNMFESFINLGRISAYYYYTWNTDPLNPTDMNENRLAAYLCDRLTESGKRAIQD